ncbi:MAG: TetR/AcrR family transcriptional regulator [Prevotella sp.]|nr:TetR/AcrR family transcriptional regulator [Prevotella sp.]
MQDTNHISDYKKGLRARIIEAAMNAFRERGIRSVTMDDVAAELGISKRTLYEIFDKKEDLLFEGVKEMHETRTARMEVKLAHCENVMEIILAVYKIKVEDFRRTNPLFYADMVKYPQVGRYLAQQNQLMSSKTKQFIERGVEEGYFRSDVNYELVGRLFDALGKYVVESRLYQQYSIEDIFHGLIFVSLRGMCTEQGVRVLDSQIG